MRPLCLALTTAAGLAACVPAARPVEPPPVPAPVAPLPAPPALAADWRDWPYSPGTWNYVRDARGSIAKFGVVGRDAVLTLRCDAAARRLYLSRSGTTVTPLTIRTSSTARTVAVQPTGGTPPYVAATLAPADGLLDAMGFSRGRFVIEQAGAAPLVIPPWAEIGRVTEDCRG